MTKECLEDLEPEKNGNDLEKEFSAVYDKYNQEINRQLKIAAEAIFAAQKISEKYCIPFYSSVSPLGQSYYPSTFPEKFGDLDSEFVTDVTGAYTKYYSDGFGWEHSGIC